MGIQKPHIKNISETEGVTSAHGNRFANTRKRLAAAAGSKDLGCSWYEVPPGKQAFPHHYHYVNEEAFFILSGCGELRLGDKKFAVTKGDYVACLPNAESAHSLRNTGTEPLQYLAFSTAHDADVMVYPDSQKFFVSAGADMHKGLKAAAFAKMLKDQPSVDYYLDEE